LINWLTFFYKNKTLSQCGESGKDKNMENVNPNISQLKLSKLTLVAYGVGDFASNLCWTFIGSYLSVFYTDVLGITPFLVSIMMLVAKVSDGIFDPIFGSIAERTSTKYGRFRPYILFGAPVLAIISILAFTKIGSGAVSATFAFVAYMLCGFMYTIVNLSYGSLSTVMTSDLDDIAQLNSFRMIGTNLSSVVLSAVTPPLLLFFAGSSHINAKGYMLTAAVFALCAIPLFYFTALNCKERIHPVSTGKKVPIKDTVATIVKNKPLLLVFLIQLFALTAFFGRMGIVVYYVMYNLGRFDLISAFMALPSLATVIGIFLTKNFVVKVGKKRMAAIGYIGSATALLAMFVIGQVWGYEHHTLLLLILNIMYGFFCFSFPIPMAMVTDAINYAEDKFGVRSDGTAYATVSLSTKFGSAFGVSLGLAVMGATGYVANSQQTSSALFGINLSVNLMMGILFLMCLIPLAFYPLNEKVSQDILDRLTLKREALQGEIDSENINPEKIEKAVSNKDVGIVKDKVVEIFAMSSGDLISLSEIKNEMFAKGMLGTGFAIRPDSGEVYAPVSGQIITIFQSKHAIGIETKEGVQVLIHMGIDTYKMKGKPFDIKVGIGDEIEVGELIAIVDLAMLNEANVEKDIIFVVTNNQQLKKTLIDPDMKVDFGESVGRIVI
jgi:sugar (glycoside-pentoside-hexuronide) transporter/glucose-specific phosphotransferase system IIA component